LKNYAGIHPKHPLNNWKHRGDKGYGHPGPCTSRERLVTASPFRICQWLLQPSTSISGVLGIFHLLSSQWPKNTSLQSVDSSGKKTNSCDDHDLVKCTQNPYKCDLKWWRAASGNPCDTGGLRSLARGWRCRNSMRGSYRGSLVVYAGTSGTETNQPRSHVCSKGIGLQWKART